MSRWTASAATSNGGRRPPVVEKTSCLSSDHSSTTLDLAIVIVALAGFGTINAEGGKMVNIRETLTIILRLLTCLLLVAILATQWVTLRRISTSAGVRISDPIQIDGPVEVINASGLTRRLVLGREEPLAVSVDDPIEVIIVGVNR